MKNTEVIYTEEFLAQDREYSLFGEKIAKAKNAMRKALGKGKGEYRANKIAHDIVNDKRAGKKEEKRHALERTFKLGTLRKATKDKLDNNIKTGRIGGAAAGAALAGAAGTGIAHLAMTKKRDRISYLETKKRMGNLSINETAELAKLKRQLNTTKILAGGASAVAGGILGHKLGKKAAEKANKNLAKSYARKYKQGISWYKKSGGN